MTRDYEILYIIDPDASTEATAGLMDRFQQLATDQGAEVQKVVRWDKRRLAYEVKGKREGIYVDMHLRAEPQGIAEVERVLRITDGVLRHITVRKDEKHVADYVPEPAPAAPEPQPEAEAQAPTAAETPDEGAPPEPGEAQAAQPAGTPETAALEEPLAPPTAAGAESEPAS